MVQSLTYGGKLNIHHSKCRHRLQVLDFSYTQLYFFPTTKLYHIELWRHWIKEGWYLVLRLSPSSAPCFSFSLQIQTRLGYSIQHEWWDQCVQFNSFWGWRQFHHSCGATILRLENTREQVLHHLMQHTRLLLTSRGRGRDPLSRSKITTRIKTISQPAMTYH